MKEYCDRCGDKMLPQDYDVKKFSAGYKPIGNDAPEWRELTLCEDCQEVLRAEFYRRGIFYHG